MEWREGMRPVTSLDELRDVVPEPAQSLWDKDIGRIDEHARTIIEHSPFLLLATSAPDGTCDVSPRGEPPGGVLILDEHTLAIPDRPGNGRVDSLRNIVANPRLGMLFLVPGMNETLRVNGVGTIVREAPFFERMAVRGKQPRLAVVVEVTELFVHCAKAFLRSGLWKPDTWPERSDLPTLGQIVKDHMRLAHSAEAIDKDLALDSARNQY